MILGAFPSGNGRAYSGPPFLSSVLRHVRPSAAPAYIYRPHTSIIQRGMSHLPFGSHQFVQKGRVIRLRLVVSKGLYNGFLGLLYRRGRRSRISIPSRAPRGGTRGTGLGGYRKATVSGVIVRYLLLYRQLRGEDLEY